MRTRTNSRAVPVALRSGPRHHRSADDGTLLLHRVHTPVEVLGPGPAAGVWVQGCDVGCEDCTSPHTWDRRAGRRATVAHVAAWLDATELGHLTLSGGEPTDQAPALVALIDTIRSRRDWVVTCYSGHALAVLRREDRPGVADLLERLDLLIDGPYLPHRHAPLLWRGSTNQQIHRLSDRVTLPADEPAGLTPLVAADGTFALIGVPPVPDLTHRLAAALGREADDPDDLAGPSVKPVPSTFPFPTTLPEED